MASETPAVGAPDARREQILRAAAETVGERGFSETRITDVAVRAGASPALVIYYFGTKDRLLTEALRWSEDGFYSEVTTLLGELGSARERLEALVRRTCVPYGGEQGRDGWGLWFDLWAQALRHPEVAKDRVELDQRWRDTIADVVREGQSSGEIRGDVDATAFTVAFAALLDGLSIQVALLDPVVDETYAFAIAMQFASAELGVDWAPRGHAARPRRTRSGPRV